MITFMHRGDNTEIEYTVEDGGDIHDLMQAFRRFLLAVSYHPETIDLYIKAE